MDKLIQYYYVWYCLNLSRLDCDTAFCLHSLEIPNHLSSPEFQILVVVPVGLVSSRPQNQSRGQRRHRRLELPHTGCAKVMFQATLLSNLTWSKVALLKPPLTQPLAAFIWTFWCESCDFFVKIVKMKFLLLCRDGAVSQLASVKLFRTIKFGWNIKKSVCIFWKSVSSQTNAGCFSILISIALAWAKLLILTSFPQFRNFQCL